MDSPQLTVKELLDRPFTIHALNNYTNLGLTNFVDELGLAPEHVRTLLRVQHHRLMNDLHSAGIAYSELGPALVPKPGRSEAAFVFDSTQVTNGMYGYSFAEKWIPALQQYGPQKTVIRVGDILTLPSPIVWRLLEKTLIGSSDFPRQARELYFAVYITNLSPTQIRDMHGALTSTATGYLGYVDCSTWNLLKAGLHLPQVGLRIRDSVITETDDGGTANQVGYPFEENGFRIVGIDDELYSTFLCHRLDNGVPSWADDDSSIALTVLGGDRRPIASTDVVIDDGRIRYLGANHGKSLSRAGLDGLGREALATAIRAKFKNGLIYNLRFTLGMRDGVPDSTLNAMMYSVQVEFPDASGTTRRYQVGLKYTPDSHLSEVTTFY